MPSPSASQPSMEDALKSAFPNLKEDTLVEAENICIDARLTATEFYCKWEAFAISRRRGTEPPTSAELRELGTAILKANKARSGSTPSAKAEPRSVRHRPAPPPRIDFNEFFSYAGEDDLVGADGDGDASMSPLATTDMHDPPGSTGGRAHRAKTAARTPAGRGAKEEPELAGDGAGEAGLIRSAPLFADPSGMPLPGDDVADPAFEGRAGVGRVDATLNAENKGGGTRAAAPRVDVLPQYVVGDAFRFMNDDLPGRIEAVRAQVRDLSARVLARAKAALPDGAELPPCAPSVFFTPSSDTVLAVGRVRVELDETDGGGVGRINSNSVMLESVDGHILRLNLGRIRGAKKQLFLHPGMVLAVEGVNTNGRIMDVSEVHDNTIPLPEAPAATKEEDAMTDAEEIEAPVLRVLVAGGPYTTVGNLRYEPLDELGGVIASSAPDVVVLTGPFVDSAHPLANEQLPVTFEKLFEDRVLARIEKFARAGEKPPHFVLVPALDDAHHDFVAPQPPLAPERELPSNVTLVANPAVVRVSDATGMHEVALGMSSLPALQDISADCVCWNKADRFGAIASHMIRQTSFYPTNPPSANVPLDASHLGRVAMPAADGRPGVDVLLIPSKLKAFAKIADAETLVVNPGILTRGSSGGTYAEISVPMRRKGERRRGAASIPEKSCAEIVRI